MYVMGRKRCTLREEEGVRKGKEEISVRRSRRCPYAHLTSHTHTSYIEYESLHIILWISITLAYASNKNQTLFRFNYASQHTSIQNLLYIAAVHD